MEINKLFETFKFEQIESGQFNPSVKCQLFVEHMLNLFPNIKRCRKRMNGKFLVIYNGMSVKQHPKYNERT